MIHCYFIFRIPFTKFCKHNHKFFDRYFKIVFHQKEAILYLMHFLITLIKKSQSAVNLLEHFQSEISSNPCHNIFREYYKRTFKSIPNTFTVFLCSRTHQCYNHRRNNNESVIEFRIYHYLNRENV